MILFMKVSPSILNQNLTCARRSWPLSDSKGKAQYVEKIEE